MMPDAPDNTTTPAPVTRPDHHGRGADQPVVDGDAKKRRRKKLLRVAIVLLLFGAVLAAFAPTLLSTGPGTAMVVSILNSQVDGEVAIDSLDLGWKSQSAQGLTYTDTAQGVDVRIGSIDAGDVTFFGLITGSMKLGDVSVLDSHVVLTEAVVDQTQTSQQLVTKSESKPFTLPQGMSVSLVIHDLTIDYVVPGQETVSLVKSSGSVQMPDLRDITFDFRATVQQGLSEGSVSFDGGVLNLFDFDGVAQAEQAAYDITLDVVGVPTEAVDQVVSGFTDAVRPGLLSALLGEGQLAGDATVKGTLDKLKSQLTIESPKFYVELDQLAEGDALIASPESSAYLDLDQAGFKALFPDSGLELQKPSRIDLTSLEMALPIVDEAVDWEQSTASLVLKADDHLAVVDERGEVLGINDLRIVGGSESIAGKLSFKLTTTLSAVDADSKVASQAVTVDLDVIDPLEQTRQIEFFSEKLPITLVDALIGKDWQLPLWLGETLELDADLQGKLMDAEQVAQHFSLRPEGLVAGTVSGSFSEGSYRFSTPRNEPIKAVLSPEAFAHLMEVLSGREGEPALTIEESMPVYVTLRDPKRGAVSIKTRQGKVGIKRFYPDPDQTYLGATIELSPARVFDPKLKKTYELRGGMLSLSAPDLRGKTDIRAELDLWVRPDAGKEGVGSLLTWQTTVTDLLDSEGSMPLDGPALMQQLAASGAMRLENVPSGLMDSLLNRQGDLASILGPIVQDMDAGFTYKDGQPTGATVRLNWDDKNNQPLPDAWASMKPAAFDIDDQQMLTVRGGQDLELEVRVSEDFGDRWMGQLHPILFDAKSGDRPVKIKIDGKSFRFPLQGEAMLGSRVEASVDLGTIEFGDDALLGKLMQWTDRPGERAVFEPAIVKLVDGKVSYDQFDLAVGKVKLRLDGEVDLASGQIVDMAVRVPGDSLIRVFNELDGLIKPEDFLSIPMSGAIRKPKFDSQLIGKEVARLVTRGLIDKQKDSLKDLIRKGIGGDDDQPEHQGDGAKPDGEQEPKEQDPAEDVADELINRGLDLLFKRLGKDKKEPKQE